MKLSPQTILLLKNFATINTGLFIPAGNRLRIKNPTGSLLAEVTVKETFPVDVCITDLPRFLNIVGLEDDTEIEFNGNDIVITSGAGKSRTTYRMGSPKHVAIPGKLPFDLNKQTVLTVDLTQTDLIKCLKAAAMLGLPTFSIDNDGEELSISAYDQANKSENVYTTKVKGFISHATTQKIVLGIDKMQFIPGDYKVNVWNGLVQFVRTRTDSDLTYFISPDSSSNFGAIHE